MPPPSAMSKPLISDNATAVGFILPNNCLHWPGTNWCGTTKMRISASLAASTRSGTATYLTENLWQIILIINMLHSIDLKVEKCEKTRESYLQEVYNWHLKEYNS